MIHDFKPTAYLTDANCNGTTDPSTICVILRGELYLGDHFMDFPVGEGRVRLFLDAMPHGDSIQLPPVGEWTRVELTHEFDDNAGKYFISLSFAGSR